MARPRKFNDGRVISMHAPKALEERLNEVCRRYECTMSDLVRTLLEASLDMLDDRELELKQEHRAQRTQTLAESRQQVERRREIESRKLEHPDDMDTPEPAQEELLPEESEHGAETEERAREVPARSGTEVIQPAHDKPGPETEISGAVEADTSQYQEDCQEDGRIEEGALEKES